MKNSNRMQEESKDEIETEEFIPYNEIDKLQNMGINAADLTKLKTAGYCTVMSVVMATRKDLLNVKGISDAKIEKLQEAAGKVEATGFITGTDVLMKRQNLTRISTGSKSLDELLGGGVESMAITEIFGEFRTGKTQVCHTMCVTAQLPKSQGGGNGKVAYIDTESTFRPERICKIAERFGLDGEAVLDNITYGRAYTTEHQNQLLALIAAKMTEETYSLLIIDSIMALFRVDYSGRGELSERQQYLGKMLSKLLKLAEQFNVAVLITNQDPGAGMTFMADPKKPIGGNILAHASTTRLYFKKGKGEQRICKIYDSPCLPESECTFQIGESGIMDADE